MTVMAPGDSHDIEPMLAFALQHDGPVAMRYPKTAIETIERSPQGVTLGKSEVIRRGRDGVFLACGSLLADCVAAADRLSDEHGMDVGVINARFVKPLDTDMLEEVFSESGFVITVEENVLTAGFGAAVLEAAADLGLDTRRLHRRGLPDAFIELGDRGELLGLHGLDVDGLIQAARSTASTLASTVDD
jgi:1-deoxy-D-xylulose-5-phosphate synthase